MASPQCARWARPPRTASGPVGSTAGVVSGVEDRLDLRLEVVDGRLDVEAVIGPQGVAEGDDRGERLLVGRGPALEAGVVGELNHVLDNLPVDALRPALLEAGEVRVLVGGPGGHAAV